MTVDPVKTLVLDALATMLGEINEIGAVRPSELFPADPDNLYPDNDNPASLPVLFIWEDEDRDRWGRLAYNKLHIHLQVYMKLPEDTGIPGEAGYPGFGKAANYLAAKIQAKLAAPAPLRSAGAVEIEEGEVHKSPINLTWGQLIMPYTITYAHVWGNPRSTKI